MAKGLLLLSSRIFILLFLSFWPTIASAKDSHVIEEVIEKQFPITADGNVTIANQFGNVDVKTWEQENVKYIVTLRIEGKTRKKTQQMHDQVQILFDNTPESVSASMQMPEKIKNWIPWNTKNKNRFQIDYVVYIPKTCHLRVENRQGEVRIAEVDNAVTAVVNYGKIIIDGVNGDLTLDMVQSHGHIASAQHVDANIHYATATIYMAHNMDIKSSFSKITIENGHSLEVASNYDTYTIGEIRHLYNLGSFDHFTIAYSNGVEIESKYTEIHVDYLADKLKCNMKHGRAHIYELAKDFSAIQLNGQYTVFDITAQDDCAFVFSVFGKYANISYPEHMQVCKNTSEKYTKTIAGYIHSADAPRTLKAELNYGGLVLGTVQ